MGAVNPLPQWQYFNSTIEKQFSYEQGHFSIPPPNVYEVLNTIFECIQPLKFYIILTSCTVYLYIHVCMVYCELIIISAGKVMSYIHNHSLKICPSRLLYTRLTYFAHYFSLLWFWLGHCWGFQTCVESVKSPFSPWQVDWNWSNWSLPRNWQFRLGAVF